MPSSLLDKRSSILPCLWFVYITILSYMFWCTGILLGISHILILFCFMVHTISTHVHVYIQTLLAAFWSFQNRRYSWCCFDMSIGGCKDSVAIISSHISTIVLTNCPIKHTVNLILSPQFKMWCSHSDS